MPAALASELTHPTPSGNISRAIQRPIANIGTQRLSGRGVSRHRALHREHLLSSARADGDSAIAGRGLQFLIGGCGHFDEERLAVSSPVQAVEHQAVQVDVQVGG
jgi:hypothetical protein